MQNSYKNKFWFFWLILILNYPVFSQPYQPELLLQLKWHEAPNGFPWINNLTAVEDKLYFSASDSSNGFNLWESDGTIPGTKIVPLPHRDSLAVERLFSFDGELILSTSHKVHKQQLWVWNETDYSQLFTFSEAGPTARGPRDFKQFNDLFLFKIWNDIDKHHYPWISDGTPSGTNILTKKVFDWKWGEANSSGMAFIVKTAHEGNELWFTDGTDVGTKLLKDIWPGPKSSDPMNFTVMEDKIYFSANDSVHGRELWVTDGTEEGTRMVKDLFPGERSGFCDTSISNIVAHNGHVYFEAAESDSSVYFGGGRLYLEGYNLYRSDGTEKGTERYRDVVHFNSKEYEPHIWDIFHLNGNLCFAEKVNFDGPHLFCLDEATDSIAKIGPADFWMGIVPNEDRLYKADVNGISFFVEAYRASELRIVDFDKKEMESVTDFFQYEFQGVEYFIRQLTATSKDLFLVSGSRDEGGLGLYRIAGVNTGISRPIIRTTTVSPKIPENKIRYFNLLGRKLNLERSGIGPRQIVISH